MIVIFFNDIQKDYDGNFILLIGVPADTFISDIRRIYKFDLDVSETTSDISKANEVKRSSLFFDLISSGVLIKKLAVKFHRYFALEMYFMFDRLYQIVQRDIYKEASDLLIEEPNVNKYFTPLLELPSDIQKKIDSLPVPLYPFQRDFISSYYNARNKLKLNGYILSFEAGGGKTFTSIAASYIFDLFPAIITAPKSTLDGWKKSILSMIKSVKNDEVVLSYEYNPKKNKKKWKFFICNYERLDQALEYSKFAVSKPCALLIDEAHNFRYMDTNRVQKLLNVKNTLNIQDVIAISGTPIKALASELIPIIKLIDPDFDDYAESIFKKIYSRSSYDPIAANTIQKRLALMLERRKIEDSGFNLPPKERFNVECTIKDPTPYLLSSVKENMWNYVNDHKSEYTSNIENNYNDFLKLLDSNIIKNNIEESELNNYKELVKTKMNDPLSKDSFELGSQIKQFEEFTIREFAGAFTNQIIIARKKCTSYMQQLLGVAMGIYYVKGKIELICKMIQENINGIINIINNGELKTIIFATYIDPLFKIQEILQNNNIGCVLHKGGDDIRVTRETFKNDNSIKCFLGTIQAVGTGTDGLQQIASQAIFVNRPYRDVDLTQAEARIWRKGSNASKVKFFFLSLNTHGQKNLLDGEREITEWSRYMVKLAVD